VTYPDAGLGCLPDSSYRIVAFSGRSAFYEILPTTWDPAARTLTCEVRHFSGHGVDRMSDYEFLRYLITEASKYAQQFPGEDDLARLLSCAQEAALHGWQDLVDLAVAGGEPVLDLLAASAIMTAALQWAMLGDIQGDSQAFITEVQQWLDDCGSISFAFGADKGEVYNMVLEPEERNRAQVTFTVRVTNSAGEGLAGKSVQIYWDEMQAGKFGPMYPGGYGSTGEDGTYSVVQGATTVLGAGGCLPSKTVHYYAEVYHDERWRRSQTISVTYRQLMIYNSISYEFSYDASQDSYVATAAASLLGEGASPNGCTGAANCDGLLTRSYTRDRGYDTTTSVEEDSRIPACRASLEYSPQVDPVTGKTYLVVSGIRVRDLDEIFHDLTVETCRADGGCTTSAGYNVGLCGSEAGPAYCNPINSSVVYWSPQAIGDLVFPHLGNASSIRSTGAAEETTAAPA
jgi:hypothetical protein